MTDRQRRFADEYLIDLNATRAYKAAYPSVKRDETAKSAASRLLTYVDVQAYIQEHMQARQERTQITQDMVLREIAAIAFADINDVVEIKNGSVFLADTGDLTPEQRKIIAGVKEGQAGVEIKFFDRLRALELLGKHLGLFDPRKDQLDQQEQEARIAKLRAETRTEETMEDKAVVVRFIGTGGAEK